ncbi:MAG TPA: hypothetical protein VNE86_07025 [Nitrososphaerales archaeon]|nr:hypothetical protein [Nitrososphaerales archaeon]
MVAFLDFAFPPAMLNVGSAEGRPSLLATEGLSIGTLEELLTQRDPPYSTLL